jgi:hypothetical protein
METLEEKLRIFVFGLDRMGVGVIVSLKMRSSFSIGLFLVMGGVGLGMPF